jgi:hypothetical protein
MHDCGCFGGNWPATARLRHTSAVSGETTAAALPLGRAATSRRGLLLPCPGRHADPRARGSAAAAPAGSAAGWPTRLGVTASHPLWITCRNVAGRRSCVRSAFAFVLVFALALAFRGRR